MKVKSFGLRRTFDYFKMNLFLMWKNLIEYKINFFSSILSELIYLTGILLFFNIMYNNFKDVVPWSYEDFVLYFFLYAIIFTFSGLFFWKSSLFDMIKSGKLNLYLIRPINQMYFYLFSQISSVAFVMFLLYLTFFIGTILYYKIVLVNILFAILISILVIILIIFFYHFIFSLDLILLGLTNTINSPLHEIRGPMEVYPEPFFKQNYIKLILIGITPMFFVSSLIVPILKGYIIWNLKLQLIVLFSFIVILVFGTLFNWKFGLKKYVAFS